jgi:hypothetical protein
VNGGSTGRGGAVSRAALHDAGEQRQRVRRFARPEQILHPVQFRCVQSVRQLTGNLRCALCGLHLIPLRLLQGLRAPALAAQQPRRAA